MSISSMNIGSAPASAPLQRLALPIFATTIFASALLLFSLEPLFTKMALPSLGGSSSVWSIAMVFFQGLMFAGYCYAHVLTRWISPRCGALLHLCLLAAAFVSLPVIVRMSATVPAGIDPAMWLMGVFALSVGLPFFALSAQGPLLQAWFSRSGHAQANDPYFLYGASNIGSFAALILYPLAVEPLVGLAAQGRAWTWGFAILAAMMAACAWSVFSARACPAIPASVAARETAPVSASRWVAWAALAFVPSGLLISVTAHISTDVAAAPLLWVLPLGLYLLTFVLAFRDRPQAAEARTGVAQAWLGAAVLMVGCIGMFSAMFAGLAVHLLLFFVNAMVCHGALYRLRPGARDLTLFYAVMSLGGALGGLFAGLLAPLLFSSVAEYPLLIAAAFFCRPGAMAQLRSLERRDLGKLVALAGALLLGAWAAAANLGSPAAPYLIAVVIGVAILLNWRSPGRTAILGLAATLASLVIQAHTFQRENFRSFFGVHRISEEADGKFRLLVHGNTMHGAMRIRNEDGTPATGRPQPTTYYHPDGPLGDAVKAARAAQGTLKHAAFIGLGVGSLACHVNTDEAVTYFEIDPLVVKIASDPSRFRFISDCAPHTQFVVGDARLTLAAQPGLSDLIVVDAFSSDAIPVHLLTRDAFAMYVRKLSSQGLIAVHISNNHMEFSGIIARIAADLGLLAYGRKDMAIKSADHDLRSSSIAVVLAREPVALAGLTGEGTQWRRLEADMSSWVWTDDYSTILSAITAKMRN